MIYDMLDIHAHSRYFTTLLLSLWLLACPRKFQKPFTLQTKGKQVKEEPGFLSNSSPSHILCVHNKMITVKSKLSSSPFLVLPQLKTR